MLGFSRGGLLSTPYNHPDLVGSRRISTGHRYLVPMLAILRRVDAIFEAFVNPVRSLLDFEYSDDRQIGLQTK